MKSRVSSLMALVAGAFGGNAEAFAKANEAARNYPTRTSKVKSKGAARVRPAAPWLPNVKGTRFEKGVRVSR